MFASKTKRNSSVEPLRTSQVQRGKMKLRKLNDLLENSENKDIDNSVFSIVLRQQSDEEDQEFVNAQGTKILSTVGPGSYIG